MKKEEDRTTPFGLWRYAKEFSEAGHIILENTGSVVSMPALFLFGQSIELSLKAFLLKRGISLNNLKYHPFGHDLLNLLKESRRRKLGMEVKLEPSELANIELLNLEYKDRRFQYIKTGTMTVPHPNIIDSISMKLVRGLRNYCTGFNK